MVAKEGFELILSDGHQSCGAMQQTKAENRHEWTESRLRVTKAFRRDEQVVALAEAINSSRLRNTFTAILRTDRSLLSKLNAVRN